MILRTLALFLILFPPALSIAAIYGIDSRQEISQVPWLREQARAVAVAIPVNLTHLQKDGSYFLEFVEPLGGGSSVNVCRDERFTSQPSLGNCTGFLISDKYLITAGHCVLPAGIATREVRQAYCENFAWYFDYNVNASGKTTGANIPAKSYFRCKRVIRAENIEIPSEKVSTNLANDFAVIELERAVPSEIKPLTVSKKAVKKGDVIFTIGHPSGLPAKYSGLASVTANDNAYHFTALLDTLSGNSGGPVFNSKKEVVGILTGGHPVDYVDTSAGCQAVNRCSQDGKTCSGNSEFDWLPTASDIQRIGAAMRYVR